MTGRTRDVDTGRMNIYEIKLQLSEEDFAWLLEAARHHPGGYGHIIDGLREAWRGKQFYSTEDGST